MANAATELVLVVASMTLAEKQAIGGRLIRRWEASRDNEVFSALIEMTKAHESWYGVALFIFDAKSGKISLNENLGSDEDLH